MDEELIGIICGIIGFIATAASTSMGSKIVSLIVAAVGLVLLGVSFVCLDHPFAGGLIMGGVVMWGSSFVFAKIRGESVLVSINWLSLRVGTIVAIVGGWLCFG